MIVKHFKSYRPWPTAILIIAFLSACSSSGKVIKHGFEFDARWDSTDVRILNYRYGDSKHPGAYATEYMLSSGKVAQHAGIFGAMRRGDELYVKWQIQSTGRVHEDTVDLKHLLPYYITRKKIRFIINEDKLHVYLISQVPLPSNPCPSRRELKPLAKSNNPDDRIFSRYCYLRIHKIYPAKP